MYCVYFEEESKRIFCYSTIFFVLSTRFLLMIKKMKVDTCYVRSRITKILKSEEDLKQKVLIQMTKSKTQPHQANG